MFHIPFKENTNALMAHLLFTQSHSSDLAYFLIIFLSKLQTPTILLFFNIIKLLSDQDSVIAS